MEDYEAKYWIREGERIRCLLCPHRCLIKEGESGICKVRKNEKGFLKTLVFSKIAAANIDPIEKKPFFHFFPGSFSFSIATVGCNFRCIYCQNWSLSQAASENGSIYGEELIPEKIVIFAKRNKCKSISYTYSEPTIFYETAYEISQLAKKEGLYNNFVTNGFIEREPLLNLKGLLDAANVDLKSFSEDFYKKYCFGSLKPVLETLILMKKIGIWVEVTTLLIPSLNDSVEEIRNIARFIKNELGEETPWHISRFHPDYKLSNIPPTSIGEIEKARQIGFEEGLFYVYTGNIWGDEGENTFCPNCKEQLIKRYGFKILEKNLKGNKCKYCDFEIAGVF